jgi:hypothetical protein
MEEESTKAAPKIPATHTLPVDGGRREGAAVPHDERVIDEAVDESFPASDPPSVTDPGSALAVKLELQERMQRRRESGDDGRDDSENAQ